MLSLANVGQIANPFGKSVASGVYSTSLSLAVRANGWTSSVAIPISDLSMYLRAFYATEGNTLVEMLYTPVGCECASGSTTKESLMKCYAESKNCALGVQNVGFVALANNRV